MKHILPEWRFPIDISENFLQMDKLVVQPIFLEYTVCIKVKIVFVCLFICLFVC